MTSTMLADPEAALTQGDHASLRLWLRLYTCATMVERTLDTALKREFGSSLPRFDLLSQLYRAPRGLRMGELSERILTTGGNVTWLVSALARDGYVQRRADDTDRRAAVVRLTAAGRRHFLTMAAAHEALVTDLLGGLSAAERRTLYALLGTTKQHLLQERTAS